VSPFGVFPVSTPVPTIYHLQQRPFASIVCSRAVNAAKICSRSAYLRKIVPNRRNYPHITTLGREACERCRHFRCAMLSQERGNLHLRPILPT